MTNSLFGLSKTASLDADAQGLRLSRERVAEITVGGVALRAATLDQETSTAKLGDGISAADVLAASEDVSLSRNAGLASRLGNLIGQLGLERVFTASDQSVAIGGRAQRVSEGMRAAGAAQETELTPEMQVRGLLRAPFLWEAQMTYENAGTGASMQAAYTGAAVETRLNDRGNIGLDDESLAMSYGTGGGSLGYRGDGANFAWGLGYGYASLSFDPWALTMSRRGAIETGAGDDRLAISRSMQVLAGDGDNVLALVSVREAQAGKGDDTIAANDVGTLDAGDGDNTIEALDAGAILSGRGRDKVSATNAAAIDVGAGDDMIDATRVGLVIGGAGNDTITLREATALYRRGDGNDTIKAGVGAAISFADISRDQVNIARELGADGRVTALTIALKDGSGSVRIETGERGAEDAVLRFADGQALKLADLDGARAQAQATRSAYADRREILVEARAATVEARGTMAQAIDDRAQAAAPGLEKRALSWLATAVDESTFRGADSLRMVTTSSMAYRLTPAQRAAQAAGDAAARRILDDARRASTSIVSTPQATWLDAVTSSSTLNVVVRPEKDDTRMTLFFIGDVQGRSGFLFVNRGNDRARTLLTAGDNGWRDPRVWFDDRTKVPWKALMSAVGEMIALQSGAAAALADVAGAKR